MNDWKLLNAVQRAYLEGLHQELMKFGTLIHRLGIGLGL